MEANAQGLKCTKQVVNMMADQTFQDERLPQEEEIICAETRCILDKCFELGEGDIAVGVCRGVEAGVLDVPFAPCRANAFFFCFFSSLYTKKKRRLIPRTAHQAALADGVDVVGDHLEGCLARRVLHRRACHRGLPVRAAGGGVHLCDDRPGGRSGGLRRLRGGPVLRRGRA